MLFLYEEKLIQGNFNFILIKKVFFKCNYLVLLAQTQCWIELGSPWRWQLYMSLVATVLFALPALIISACYAIIVRTIWAKGAIYLGPTGMPLNTYTLMHIL